MKRYGWKRTTSGWYYEVEPSYKCAGGCGAKVDRPFEQCLACTMEWLHVGAVDPNPDTAA